MNMIISGNKNIKSSIGFSFLKTLLFAFICCLTQAANAQDSTAHILKQPADWSFERFSLPPQFAPGFLYKGFEELRFSPGMFDKNSDSYFTYAFVAQINNVTTMSENDIKNYLLTYYKGLCNSTAKDRKLVIDTSKITVSIEKKQAVAKDIIYTAQSNLFGVFADGAPVALNLEIKAMKDLKNHTIYLLFIASPHNKMDAIWIKLYQIQREFVIPN